MEHKIIKPDNDFELETQVKKSEHRFTHPDEVIDNANIYWLVCAYFNPFMPMSDLSFAF